MGLLRVRNNITIDIMYFARYLSYFGVKIQIILGNLYKLKIRGINYRDFCGIISRIEAQGHKLETATRSHCSTGDSVPSKTPNFKFRYQRMNEICINARFHARD